MDCTRPGTDAGPWQKPLAYVWMKAGTYDKQYVMNDTQGFRGIPEAYFGRN